MKLRVFYSLFSIALTFNLASSIALACDIHGKTGIVENNDLYIPVGLKTMGGINENQFNSVINKIESIYAQKIKKLGANLTINRYWQDGTVNAYAHREELQPNDWHVSMFGGLARHPKMSEDAFAAVVCHELGHHLGGAPKKKNSMGTPRWATNEGQADYYATLKCLRQYFSGQNNQQVISGLKVSEVVENSCKNVYSNSEEQAICIRSALAGEALGNFFNSLGNSRNVLSFSTPDKNKVKITFDGHPASQCRLDTYFQGALCDKSLYEDVSDTDFNIGTCTLRNGDSTGLRPTCWFAE